MDLFNIVFSTVLASVVGLVVWFIQSRIEQIRRERDRLHDDRRKIYADLLEPYIRMFSAVNDPKVQAQVTRQIVSMEYRKTSFEFSLLASDQVVRAFNDMMQFFFTVGEQADPIKMLTLWGAFLLEIRKSIGEPKTKLTAVEMLRGQITDIDQVLGKGD